MRKNRKLAVYAAITATAALGFAALAQAPALADGTTAVTLTVSCTHTVLPGKTAHVSGGLGVTLSAPETVTVTRTTRAGTTTLTEPVATDGTFAFDDAPGTTGTVTYAVSYPGDDTYAAANASTSSFAKPLAYDFNGDGYADLAVGSDGEAIGSIKDAGTEYVFSGTANGVTTTGAKDYEQGGSGLVGTAEKNDYFGFSTASGDFNGDGFADLAISAPNETIDGHADAGDVTVMFGSKTGLTTTGSVVEYGSKKAYAYMGNGLAAADFNGDGKDELASGSPGTAAVYIYSGLKPGSTGTAKTFSQGVGGVPGHQNDSNGARITNFGANISAGDVNGDGYQDLAVGAPTDWNSADEIQSGSVVILKGGSSGLSVTGAQLLSLDTSGVYGQPSSYNFDKGNWPDEFGSQTRLADVNGDGKDDLVVSAEGRPITNSSGKHEDAGAVYVLYSTGSSITGTNSTYLTQDTAGITGKPGTGDYWGAELVAGDLNGDGKADIVATGTDTYVDYIPGSSAGPVTTSSTSYTEDTAGVTGENVAGDDWGGTMMIVPVKGVNALPALVVGAPGKHGSKGSLTVMYSTPNGPTGTGSLYIDQDSPNVPGTAETGDLMGTFAQ